MWWSSPRPFSCRVSSPLLADPHRKCAVQPQEVKWAGNTHSQHPSVHAHTRARNACSCRSVVSCSPSQTSMMSSLAESHLYVYCWQFCSWWRPSWSKHSTINPLCSCYSNCAEYIRNTFFCHGMSLYHIIALQLLCILILKTSTMTTHWMQSLTRRLPVVLGSLDWPVLYQLP